MDWTTQRKRFRAILAGSSCIHPASVADPLAARIADLLGFEAGMFAGSLGALTVLAAPDMSLITLTEFAQQANRVCRAASLPVMVDADDGFGNALNVMRTVQELETAGVAMVTIEDTLLPRRFGKGPGKLSSVEEGAGKLRAALRARQDPGLTVVARTQAARRLSVPEVIERLRAYEATGVDALWVGGLKTRDQIEAIAAATKLPLMLGGVPPALMDRSFLAEHRVRTCLQGHLPIKASVQAVYETLKALRAGTAPAEIGNLASDELMDSVTRAGDYDAWTREYLGGR